MDWNSMYKKETKPEWVQISDYIQNNLWNNFTNTIQTSYQVEPSIEYSTCSMEPGWNVKYKKSSKALCTLYPKEGYYRALVVVGNKEMAEAELLIPSCSSYVQEVFNSTQLFNGQKWIMLDVKSKETVDDIIKLIHIRKKPKQ